MRIARCRQTGATVAIKIFKRDDAVGNHFLKNIVWEAEVMMQLRHENIVEFKDLFVTKNYVYLVMEKLDMDLYTYLKIYYDRLTESDIQSVFKKITCGIKHCHDNNIMHRDIKPENILVNVDANGKIRSLKITDFG